MSIFCTLTEIVTETAIVPFRTLPVGFPIANGPQEFCEVGGVVQGDEGPVCGVAQVSGYHGVTVVVFHQEEGQEEEVEKQGEVEGDGEKLKDHYTWMECGWNDKTSASGLSHVV